jgi:hypothetical protein
VISGFWRFFTENPVSSCSPTLFVAKMTAADGIPGNAGLD